MALNRPPPLNAVDVRMRNALLAAIEEIRDDPGTGRDDTAIIAREDA
ncbi:MAG TPA: hypothetical protein VHZ03_27780 [Trebonia sp.]|nr:hypothetical protein [Trebonia sp.]